MSGSKGDVLVVGPVPLGPAVLSSPLASERDRLSTTSPLSSVQDRGAALWVLQEEPSARVRFSTEVMGLPS